jgi:hypothetical protein
VASSRRKKSWLAVVGVLVAVALLHTGAIPDVLPTVTQGPGEAAPVSVDAKTVLEQLAALPVKGRAPKTGYQSDSLFWGMWSDPDHNGCDTRNDILARDMTNVTFKEGTRDCVVATGTLVDPYTGKTINFTRGEKTSSAVQIDHVVPRSDAWQKGAAGWNKEQRERFANDPANLLAVDGPTNSSKSDGDAATWLPPNKNFRCQYVSTQIKVKAEYGLWVTQAEHDTMEHVLESC